MSNLLVQNIKHTNGTTAQTIDSSGNTTVSQILKTPARPAFSATTNNGQEWGQNHSDTVYDTAYKTPIPIWLDANTTTHFNVGGGTLSFETHPIGSGKYLKYVAPVTGVYVFTMAGSIRLQVQGDYASTGFQVNSAAEAGAPGGPTFTINGYQAYQNDAHMPAAGTALLSLTAGDYVVPYSSSVSEGYVDSNFPLRVTGYLLG